MCKMSAASEAAQNSGTTIASIAAAPSRSATSLNGRLVCGKFSSSHACSAARDRRKKSAMHRPREAASPAAADPAAAAVSASAASHRRVMSPVVRAQRPSASGDAAAAACSETSWSVGSRRTTVSSRACVRD